MYITEMRPVYMDLPGCREVSYEEMKAHEEQIIEHVIPEIERMARLKAEGASRAMKILLF